MEYFTLKEFTKSDTATKLGIPNEPNKEQVRNIECLVESILDPLREEYGKPIVVSSGFRCKKLNHAIGGALTSQHCKGQAADIVATSNKELKRLFLLVLYLDLPFDQLIYERGQWMHVSYKEGGVNRHQILTFDGKSYYYCNDETLWNVICGEPLPIRYKKDELPYGGCSYK